MIELAIEHDDEALRADGESPTEAPAAALEETYFVVPTRFAVNGKELLAYPGGAHEAWRPLPLLGFGPRLRDIALSVKDGDAATISLAGGGSLELRREVETVVLKSSLAGDEVRASHDELMATAAAFATDVCNYLQSVLPSLATHPAWRNWCGASDDAAPA